eukprot:CAMPEP_0201914770 /NCGR_PEP_ID=MMETSP0903-20130614/4865_1 /ASSEMBLY_ACC=CAM_ASM_000552 /TAXON_ID=420261 /ORGANISM="Thalassiosira antarctica, Strain CCMP982" /LENGTH=506 /DNA_ID=CAMNT_0048450225 /DNA_START=104 /DNA_END=1621 /DNA_ORIENTATION=-
MGRKLAQERSKNHQLTQQILELEHTVSLLKQGKHDGTMENHPCSSLPQAASPTRGGIVNSSEKNDLHSMNHVQGREEALWLETRRREAAETKTAPIFQQSELTRNNDSFEVASDSSIVKLLEQASKLLSGTSPHNKNEDTNPTNPNSTNSHQAMNHDGSAGITHTQERMHEYHELVSAFHSEQESHGDIDGEELISREDILWLFKELKWRFEDILSVFTDATSKKNDETPSDNEEWKECLEGLANVVKKAMKPYSFHQTNNQQGDEHTNESTLANDTHVLQNEVSSLKQRLTSFAAQHKETCRSLHDDMEAMKRDYQEQIATKSQCIQNLETKISEQEEYTVQIQKEVQKDRQWIQEEKHKLKLSKEGTSVRIRYLEGMLRSSQMELKEPKIPQGKEDVTNSSTPIHTDGAESKKERGTLSPPIFMRDLTSAMQAVDLTQHENNSTDNSLGDKAKDGGDTQDDAKPSSNGAGITKLLDQIASLGNSLADSEIRRADLLDDFQQERK